MNPSGVGEAQTVAGDSIIRKGQDLDGKKFKARHKTPKTRGPFLTVMFALALLHYYYIIIFFFKK